MATGH